MGRDWKTFFVTTALMVGAVVLQSTVFNWITLGGVKPDLALVILVYAAVRRGSLLGETAGFASGLVEDALSLSPLGFHALSRTVVGFLYGLTAGSIFVDPLFMPVLLVVVATLLKGFLSALTAVLFSVEGPGFAVFAGPLWIEIGYNALLAPFVFAALNLLKLIRPREKGVAS